MGNARIGHRVGHRAAVLRIALAVAALVVVATACEPLTIPGPVPTRYRDEVFSAVTKTADVVYGQATSQTGVLETLKADVYTPTGDTKTSRPLVVFVHGGSFCCGTKTSPEILDETAWLTKRGYVTVSIEYRQSAHGCTTVTNECLEAIVDAREDAQTAVRFFKANAATYGIDASRVGIAGTSAGAITAINVDFTLDTAVPSSTVRGAVSLSGAAIGSSPHTGDGPIMDFHGTADPLVPYQAAVNTDQAARDKNLLSYLITWDGEGHVPYVNHRAQILDLTTRFFYWVLDLAHAA